MHPAGPDTDSNPMLSVSRRGLGLLADETQQRRLQGRHGLGVGQLPAGRGADVEHVDELLTSVAMRA